VPYNFNLNDTILYNLSLFLSRPESDEACRSFCQARGEEKIYILLQLIKELMYVGECKNGVSFAKVLPFEIVKLRSVVPFSEDEMNDLSVEISMKHNGYMILQSGYAVMWKWFDTPGEAFAIVWKQLSQSEQEKTEINNIKTL
jgi:hypothetical protein